MISQIDLFEDLMLESRLARSQWKALSFSEERLDRPVEPPFRHRHLIEAM
jgi:hypothetical protein